jgi:hypothetical protein
MYRTESISAVASAFRETLKSCEQIDRNKAKLNFSEWVVRNAIKFFAPLM